ncbi:Gfo/Idh/MocA family protein [Fredinandcohnia humi]
MSSPIRMGIIGLGAFGAKILQPISYFHTKEELQVVAVCDSKPEVARALAVQHGIPNWFPSHQQMLDEIPLDLVYIATPPSTHERITKDVIEKGIHVFCEKPLASSIQEARSMLRLAENAKVVHALHFGQNYLPGLNTFQRMLDKGYLGTIENINLNLLYPCWPPEWQQNDWIGSREGGFLLEQGIHFIQAIQRLFGRITYVESNVSYPEATQSEDRIQATMILENGTKVFIEGHTGISSEEDVSLTACGSEGTIRFDFRGLSAGKAGAPLESVSYKNELPPTWILTHIINSIHGKPAQIYDFRAGYEAQVVLEKLRQGENRLINLEPYYEYE